MSGWPEISAPLVVAAYRQGVFPMAEAGGEIRWYSPNPRAVFPLDDGFHVPRSLQKTIRRGVFEVRIDTAFEEVMRGCADRDSTWISEDIVRVYGELFAQGLAHSVEAWREGALVGGLYGVSLGAAFMGESMFSRATDASKVCLVALVERLRSRGYELLDSQIATEHLAQFGQREIPRAEYLRRLRHALARPCSFA